MPSVTQAAAEAPLILAVDVGSSSVRAIAFDRRGREIDGLSEQLAYAMRTTSDGGVEVESALLLELTRGVIDAVLERAGAVGDQFAAVALTTFWHSLLAVDEEGRALTPVYSWGDTRSARAAERLRLTLDESDIHARTGAMLHPSYFPAKIVWLYSDRSDLVERTRWWMSFGEFLYLDLFGRVGCSISMASGTGLFDQNACEWDDEIVGALPISREQLAPLMNAGDAMTGLRDAYAKRWPSLAGIPWYPALGDGACSNVGAGCVTPDRIALMVGTSGAMRVVFESPSIYIPRGLWTYRLDRNRFVVGGALSEGGNVYAFLSRLLRAPDDDELERQVGAMKPDCHGLTVLPFLAGERSTGWATNARAALVGLTLDSTPAEVVRAGLEAIAYRFTFVLERMPVFVPENADIVASGGALLASPVWVQIMADVFGRPVRLSAEREASSRGAALRALESLGLIGSIGEPSPAFGKTFEPDPGNHEVYREAIERQRELYRLLIGER